MSCEHNFVTDASVVQFFTERSRREREDLLRIFASLAASPYQRADWIQRTASGREIQVKRFGRWLLRFWVDEPVLEVRIVDVEKLTP